MRTVCLVVVVWRIHPDFPCLIAANRDEFHARPTEAAHFWQDEPQILAGRDLTAGGTWLGITRTGRFAALTNYRSSVQQRNDAPSRGGLVASILASTDSIAVELERLRRISPDYNGFNVIFCDGTRLGIFESSSGAGRELEPGIYALSNHLLDSPWPKVRNAKNRVAGALSQISDSAPLLALLRDDRPAADAELPSTGVSIEWERLLSSAFIRSADYGTRCSTVIRIDRFDQAWFDEWSWDAAGVEAGRVSFNFELQ